MSAAESTTATVAASTTPKPKGFFSLPRELRDAIYDILHEHEAEFELGQLKLRFRHSESLACLRHISHRFATEYDLRIPAQGPTHLVISHRDRDECFDTDSQMDRLSTIAALRQDALFSDIEFDFEVHDYYREYYGEMTRIENYETWIQEFIHREPQLLAPEYGGKISIRLSLKHLTYLDLILRQISAPGWYIDNCTTVSLVLKGVERLPSIMKRLGFHIYSNESRTLASWNKDTGWEVDKVALKHCRAEKILNQDLFATETESKVLEFDWTLVEDGDYDGTQGLGWNIDELTADQSRAEWNGGGEGFLVDGGVQEDSRW